MEEQNDYRGNNAVIYLRVSSEEQKKKYGFSSQLASINEKLIKNLGIVSKEENIIRDAYTGMKFRDRPELTKILAMAERHEFDILIMDTLDRLGRKGLQRELYRAELRNHGVRILTTEPGEHADDDSLMGEMVRLLYGFKAEQERNDIVRRTLNGRKERAKEGKLIPSRIPLYGYQWGTQK
jgi:site-specific DNA recombinase